MDVWLGAVVKAQKAGLARKDELIATLEKEVTGKLLVVKHRSVSSIQIDWGHSAFRVDWGHSS